MVKDSADEVYADQNIHEEYLEDVEVTNNAAPVVAK